MQHALLPLTAVSIRRGEERKRKRSDCTKLAALWAAVR
jgi:hypothetical protein